MCIIAVANQKGGTGKTTTCVNLGIGLARAGKKVLLVDADAQGSMAVSLGVREPDNLDHTIVNIMEKVINDEDIADNEGIMHHEEGVDFIPANIELAGKEGQWKNEIQPVTDGICRKYGLSGILEKEVKTGRSYKEWESEKTGKMTWRELIRKELDVAVSRCTSYEELVMYLKRNGYLIREGISKKHGPYLAIRPPDSKKAFRTYTLGKDYQVAQLKKRIQTETYIPYFNTAPRIRLYRMPVKVQTATYYQLYYVAHYHKVKHFYNQQGWKYRKERMEIEELFLQCSYLLTKGIKSEKELAEKINSLNIQERELCHMRNNLTPGEPKEDIYASLKSLRRERKMLQKIQESTEEQRPKPTREKEQEEIEHDRGTVKTHT